MKDIEIKIRGICSKCHGELVVKDIDANHSDYSMAMFDVAIAPCRKCLKLISDLKEANITIKIGDKNDSKILRPS